jgi:hypothetical protein
MKLRSVNVTSGRYLIDLLAETADEGADHKRRYALGCDVFIKHRSFAILNRLLLATSLLSGACVALWPILVQFPPVKQQVELVGVAVVQTMITGFAAFNLYAYHHYKVRQVATENILRMIAFTTEPVDRLALMVRDEMTRLDQGIGPRAKDDQWREPRPRRRKPE